MDTTTFHIVIGGEAGQGVALMTEGLSLAAMSMGGILAKKAQRPPPTPTSTAPEKPIKKSAGC